MATNKASMACMNETEKTAILSAVENFIADADREKEQITDEFRVLDREGFDKAIKETITIYMGF
jgi:hypothetical protein